MGGLVALQFLRKYGKIIDGAVLIAPLVDAAEDSKPPPGVIYIAKAISFFSPTLPLVQGNGGKNNTDIKYVKEFSDDIYNYHGKIRVNSGLAMSDAFTDLQKHLDEIVT